MVNPTHRWNGPTGSKQYKELRERSRVFSDQKIDDLRAVLFPDYRLRRWIRRLWQRRGEFNPAVSRFLHWFFGKTTPTSKDSHGTQRSNKTDKKQK